MTSYSWRARSGGWRAAIAQRADSAISGTLEEGFFKGSDGHVHTVLFHIPNGSHLIVDYYDSIESCVPTLRFPPWVISFQEVEELGELVNALDASSGYAITQIGKIERTDGKTFSRAESIEMLDALAWFLSFANGDWVGPALPVGFDGDERKWELWRAWKTALWRESESWFHPFEWQSLEELFPKFMNRWMNLLWREPLRTAIHWYIEAGREVGGIEGAIILSQTALELMAAVVVVEEQQMLSLSVFDNSSVAERLRLLFSWAGLPVQDCPAAKLEPLLKMNKTWTDVPQALASLRNSIIHANSRNRKKRRSLNDALQLASTIYLWYLELIVLRFLDYRGEYSNRITTHPNPNFSFVETVPWAAKQTP